MSDAFKTIATFQYSSEAQIIKGRLEADDIEVFLQDRFTIDTDPLVSNAIGGVKLRVKAKDAMKAQYILSSIKQYALDDDGNALHCPNCHSEKIEIYSTIDSLKSLLAFVIGLVSGTLPFHTLYKYECDACGKEFSVEDVKPKSA
ncbi:DUF2007 domain-containing protein [Subsaximicrobium wynnwilliamsii]|uniref:DUF2007 domain-containing protein n=1 Tax=Subsaximicrobium wynnwilliamsii TaxID=291179 RepID=A0A5C6ZG06_9FLAO|nr:DUF2007 domain-containing protein [Subsaximicrobium wynnwilliamsii]TXD82500.1 DUF2007 domain-containing protein [Subsaximicrobium wynnwilliamsii]TXD88143.1 DUF2007 domain-containing protein [Subsaximicrobium wynnwilliamsii]TXE02158.1 DUF2007 domain-containing protein [Subsaximicrobium wynnwilliamsii]